MSPQTIELALDQLPPCLLSQADAKPSRTIGLYLQKLLIHHGALSGRVIYFPPLMALSQFFQTNHLAVHDAFQALRSEGYDYDMKGLDDPIAFWHTSVCGEYCGEYCPPYPTSAKMHPKPE